MKNKNEYLNGENAIKHMRDILGDIWRQVELKPFFNTPLEDINKSYTKARDGAIAFGKNVHKYPRRIRWQTAGLEIVEGVRNL